MKSPIPISFILLPASISADAGGDMVGRNKMQRLVSPILNRKGNKKGFEVPLPFVGLPTSPTACNHRQHARRCAQEINCRNHEQEARQTTIAVNHFKKALVLLRIA